MPKKAKSKPKEAKKEEEHKTMCCGLKNYKNIVFFAAIAIVIILILFFTNKQAPEFEETLTPTETVEEEVEEPEPEVIVEEKLYEVTDSKVKVLKSICSDIEAGTTGSLEQQKELYDDCGIACEKTGFARFTGNKYCDTDKDLICYCLE